MSVDERLRRLSSDLPAWKRLVIGLTATATVVTLVNGCGLFPSAGSILGGPEDVNVNTVPKYVSTEFATRPSLSQSWLQAATARKAVTLSVTLDANQESLNGYSHGFAEVDVPEGWQVTVNFTNKNNVLPGGLMVVEPSALVSTKHVAAAIPGASMKQPYQGIGLNQSASFSFVADKPGTYVLWSAPSGGSGTWMWFKVVPNASSPVVRVKHLS